MGANDRTTSRQLFTGTRKCPYRCSYCFAKFDGYAAVKPHATFDARPAYNGGLVLYPSCDSEFFLDSAAHDELTRLIKETDDSVRVSISVKSPLKAHQIDYLEDVNAELIGRRRGFVKCSYSFAAKHGLDTIEPGTPAYSMRVSSLRDVARRGIPTSVNLKPVLPFVAAAEYEEIIRETVPYAGAFLLGGLYFDPATDLGRRVMLEYGGNVTHRAVNWLQSKPVWHYCEVPAQMHDIASAVEALGGQAFRSDLDVVEFLGRKHLRPAMARDLHHA